MQHELNTIHNKKLVWDKISQGMADGGYSRSAQPQSKNITRFATATKFLETNDKNGRCLNQWTVFLAANQPQNLVHLNFRRCEQNHNGIKSNGVW